MRGHSIEGSRDSAPFFSEFWPVFPQRFACIAVFALIGALFLAAEAGFGQEKPADAAGKQLDPNQLWVPQVNAIEHCTTCHPVAAQTGQVPSSAAQTFSADPLIPHHEKDWGCTVCHRGDGAATEKEEAHRPTSSPAQPLLPISYIQASCGICHREELPDAPQLNRGRQLLNQYGCMGCHRLANVERPAVLGPDLTNIGSKVSREWLYKWMKEPRTLSDTSGNMVVNGCEIQPRMPQFQLDEKELSSLTAFLSSLHPAAVQPHQFNPQVVASLENDPDVLDMGEARFRQMFCTTCHSVAVTRAGETQLIGGQIGPELTKVGSKVNQDWLVAWLRNPQAYLPKSQMPRYQWSDRDLYLVIRYIKARLTDPDLLRGLPQLTLPSPEEIRFGRRMFLKKGCASCHVVEGMKLQEDFGPDLTRLGAERMSHLHFGSSAIPRNLIAYVESKIKDPASLNPSTEMPQFPFESGDLHALATALLSMTGTPSSTGMERLVVPRRPAEFHPTGAFAQLYERYKCYVCHQFNGYGGTLAPELSYEGSRARRQWMIDFLKNPQTLRPTLIVRMPQFNMTDEEASILADYMATSLQSPLVDSAGVDPREFTPQMAELGKQLYEVKYQCQACHTVGTAGGYVGPDLSNVGNWMTPAWVEAWLKDPQALVPGNIEPRRTMTAEEVKKLTAYLMTLRQNAPGPHAPATGEAP